jgi:hypothetical protein
MKSPFVPARSALFALLATLILSSAASAQLVHADLNGDGIRDRVDIGAHSAGLTVHTSNSAHPQQLSSPERIVRFGAADIDRDGDPDLVASTTRLNLSIWINNGHGRFFAHTVRGPLRRSPGVRSSLRTNRSRCDDDDVVDYGAAWIRMRDSVRDPLRSGGRVRHASRAPAAALRVTQCGPRAPPTPLV